MEHDFWHDRWRNNEIGFHQPDINPYLQRYWSWLQLQPGAGVLVPCCGKSQDLLWLQGQGFDVTGIEISPLAVAAFFEENRLQPDVSAQGEQQTLSIDGLKLICGDFFKLTADDMGGIAAVYDRASMIAMPLAMRQDYCQHLQAITKQQIPILLVTLEYPKGEIEGPPFSITEAEVRDIYAEAYEVVALETQDILTGNDYFIERGLTRLQERSYLLTPKKQ